MAMVKLLLDYDFNHKEDSALKIAGGASDKPILVKQFSRNVFLIKPDKRVEEMERDPSVAEDAGGEESEDENIEEGMTEEEKAEDNMGDEDDDVPEDDVMDDEDMEVNGDVGDENEDEEDEDEDDSDHDTDVVDDDDEETCAPAVEPPPRLGSKQKSLVKVNSWKNDCKGKQIFFSLFLCTLFSLFVLIAVNKNLVSLKRQPFDSHETKW